MNNSLTFQFISEPTDVNYGGKVHGGEVMKWIDQISFACARTYSEKYCVTVYVGGIRFYKPISIGALVKMEAKIIYTGSSSMHISVDVFTRKMEEDCFVKTTHCVIVFVALDEESKPTPVKKYIPRTEHEKNMESYAKRLIELRTSIQDEMSTFLN